MFSPVAFMNKQIKRKIVSIDANYTHSKLLCNLIDQQDWDFDFFKEAVTLKRVGVFLVRINLNNRTFVLPSFHKIILIFSEGDIHQT